MSPLLIAIALCALSGLPALLARRAAMLTAPLMIAGSLAGLSVCALALTRGGDIDALSAFFAAPVFLIGAVGATYAERYWPAAETRAGYVRFFFGLLIASLAMVMTTRHTIVFLASWEIVAVSSFLLIATNHEDPDARRAGWIYLASSHVATLSLFAVVALLHALTQTWAFTPLRAGVPVTALFWLAAIAFGVKAGVMPLHVWLPGAHAAAPSHVSAAMSGVAIKMGIYGLVRVLSLFDVVPPAFGTTLLVAGIVSSILGVAFALAQHDLKRLLAYHSIENIGIIVMGIGIGLVAQAHGLPLIAFLGYAGALLHVWNHGLFKSLLFLSAGAAIHSVHTREIDRMGGLARSMPWTAAAFLTGAIAISGLPPLNGFVSEWLLYIGGFRSIDAARSGAALLLMLTVPALALTGALALACFVKAFGAVFLGAPRVAQTFLSAPLDGADKSVCATHEAPLSMRIAMLPLVLACAAIGLLPAAIAPALAKAVAIALPHVAQPWRLDAFLYPIQLAALVTVAVILLAIVIVMAFARRSRRAVTWDCGYSMPTARMQYTSSSFARGLTGYFAWAMPPVVHGPHGFSLFPTAAHFESHVPDTVLDRALLPAVRGVQGLLAFARYFQRGRVQLYLLYLGVTLIALLAWSAR